MSDDVLEQFRTEWKRDLEKDTSKRKTLKGDTSKVQPKEDHESIDAQTATNGRQVAVSDTISTSQSFKKNLVSIEPSGKVVVIPDASPQPVHNHDERAKTDAADVPLSALQVYEIAVEKERQGLLSDALTNYRKAFKLDSNVDQQYRNAFRLGGVKESSYENAGNSVEETNYAQFVQVGHDYDPKKPEEETNELQEMIKMMSSLRMPIVSDKTDNRQSFRGIEALPEEILHQILCYAVVSSSATAFPALSNTCQKFFLLLHDYAIWRTLCYNTYHCQVYTGEGISVSSASEYADYVDKLAKEAAEHYGNNWKRMFIEKPRIRYNGIYISTCHYTRPGVREESLDWTSPIHLVTYFRFLRFFPDGQCLSLLTPTQPQEVVHSIQRNTKLKGVQQGRWSMTRSGQVSVEANGPANYLFFMELQIKSSSRGRHNKLTWTQFTGVHPNTAEVTQFDLKNDKSHYFHKVKSYSSA